MLFAILKRIGRPLCNTKESLCDDLPTKNARTKQWQPDPLANEASLAVVFHLFLRHSKRKDSSAITWQSSELIKNLIGKGTGRTLSLQVWLILQNHAMQMLVPHLPHGLFDSWVWDSNWQSNSLPTRS